MTAILSFQSARVIATIESVRITRAISLVLVEGRGKASLPSLVGKVFMAVAQVKANVLLISQSSAAGNICFAVPNQSVSDVLDALKDALQSEFNGGDIGRLEARDDVVMLTAYTGANGGTVVACVGEALANQGINVLVMQGGSNISVIIEAAHEQKAMAALQECR